MMQVFVAHCMRRALPRHPRTTAGVRASVRSAAAVLLLALLPAAVAVGQRNMLTVYAREQPGGAYELLADNTGFIPFTVRVEFPVLENMASSVMLPLETLVAARVKAVRLLALTPRSAAARRFEYRFTTVAGDPTTASPDGSLYLFPYTPGEEHRVMQGYDGAFSHFGWLRYSLDFDMEVGTPVRAARGGIVADVKEDSRIGGPDPSFDEAANYVMIYHTDGTFGRYLHLMPGGAAVDPGQRVSAEELIGYSGNTGRSTQPHLHFDVAIPTRKDGMMTVPVTFLGPDGAAVSPKEGFSYPSILPEEPMLP